MVANVNDRTAALFAEAEAGLVESLKDLGVIDTTAIMQAWAAQAEAVADEADPPEPKPNTLHNSGTLDGRGELSGSFDPFARAIIDRALDEAMPAYRPRPPPRAVRTPRHGSDRHRPRLPHLTHPTGRATQPPPCVSFIIAADQWANGQPGHSTDGVVIDHSIITMLSCDANLHRVIVDQHGTVLDYGRATRIITANLYAALCLRDGGCRWPGCDRPPKYTEAHHIWHWSTRRHYQHGKPCPACAATTITCCTKVNGSSCSTPPPTWSRSPRTTVPPATANPEPAHPSSLSEARRSPLALPPQGGVE